MKSADSIPAILRRVICILNANEKRRSLFILIGVFANSLIDIFGLAFVVPVIGLVIRPETIEENVLINRAFIWSHSVGIKSPKEFLVLLCGLMAGAFLFKALFGLAITLIQSRFAFSVAHRLSGKKWTHHFSQSLERIRSTNSGNIIAEISTWPMYFAQSFIVGSLMSLSEMIVVLIIAIALLVYNFTVFASIAILLVLGTLVIRLLTKKRLQDYSSIRKELEPHSFALINNSISGFLELITFDAAKAIRESFLKNQQSIFRVQSNTTALNYAPARLYEALAVTAVAGSIFIALLQDTTQTSFLQLLTFMAISAYRIMPSMSRINGIALQMRGQLHILEAMESGGNPEVEETPYKHVIANDDNDTAVHVNLVKFAAMYEALTEPVLNNVNFCFAPGKIHGVIGPSGVGKSTLIYSILGLHNHISGQIRISLGTNDFILGEDLEPREWMQKLCYLSQKPFLFRGTLRENLTFGVPHLTLNEELTLELIDRLELTETLGKSPLDFQLHDGGNNLSGGQQQRIALIRVLQLRRPLIILDEATSALNSRLRDEVFALLRQQSQLGANVILVTHDSELAGKCDDVLALGQASSIRDDF